MTRRTDIPVPADGDMTAPTFGCPYCYGIIYRDPEYTSAWRCRGCQTIYGSDHLVWILARRQES